MKKQKFYNQTITWLNVTATIDRYLVQTILQSMFNITSEGKQLSAELTDRGIDTITTKKISDWNGALNKGKWWEESFAMIKCDGIKPTPRSLVREAFKALEDRLPISVILGDPVIPQVGKDLKALIDKFKEHGTHVS